MAHVLWRLWETARELQMERSRALVSSPGSIWSSVVFGKSHPPRPQFSPSVA